MNAKLSQFSNHKMQYFLIALLLLLGLGLVNLATAQENPNDPPNQDIEIVVTSTLDEDKKNDGKCTLREAIIVANDGKSSTGKPGECAFPTFPPNGVNPDPEGDIVIRVPTAIHTLTRTDNGNEDSSTTGDLDIKAKIEIKSYDNGTLVIEGQKAGFSDRLFHVLPGGRLTIEGVTLRRGNSKEFGGAVLVDSGGELILSNSTVVNNVAGTSGGAIYNKGTATVNYVTFKNNSAPGNKVIVNNVTPTEFNLNNTYIDGGGCFPSGSFKTFTNSSGALSNVATNDPVGCNAVFESPSKLVELKFDPEGVPIFYGFEQEVNSAAIDAGIGPSQSGVPAQAVCPEIDQVFMSRPQGGGCDIGAHEREFINLAPVAGTKSIEVEEDSSADDLVNTFSLSDVAYDPEGVGLTLSNVSSPTNNAGTAEIVDAAALTFKYSPAPHFDGSDSFSYTVCDDVQCSTGIVNVTVTADEWVEVTNTSDSGTGSLRSAISVASGDLTKTIIFLIEDGNDNYCDAATINPAGPLVISGVVNINGTLLQDGACSSIPHITLSGTGTNFDGLSILGEANGSSISGLAITGFGGSGINVAGTGLPSNGLGNTIAGNTISNNGANGILLGSSTSEADGNLVENNTIIDNCGSGVLIYGLTAPDDVPLASDITGNSIRYNTISGNGWCVQPPESELNDGVTVVEGLNNNIVDNNIFANAGQSVDLGGDGPTENDKEDPDGGANYTQNYPDVKLAIALGQIGGYLNSVPSRQYGLQFWTSDSCVDGIPGTTVPLEFTYIESEDVDVVTGADGNQYLLTDADGNGVFAIDVGSASLTTGHFVIATATDPDGNTSEYSPCVRIEDENFTWFWARLLEMVFQEPTSLNINSINALEPENFDEFALVDNQGITEFGQSKWYLIKDVKPDTTLTIELSDLPANYDLLLYTDIYEAWTDLVNGVPDLDLIGAEDPTDVFAAPAWAAPAWAAPAWADSALADDEFAAPAWAPDTLAAPAWAASSIAAPAWAAPAWAAPAWADNPLVASQAYAGAQTASLVAVSALDGLAPERIVFQSFDYSGDFYIRVGGRNGAFDPVNSYRLDIGITYGQCQTLGVENFEVNPTGLPIEVGTGDGFETLILWDQARILAQYPEADYPGEIATLAAKLQALADETDGKVVDVGLDGQVAALNSLADANPGCVSTKNVVAESVREIVKAYRAANPGIKYLLFIGNDEVIPDFRHADNANLGPESDYSPPVENDPITSSFAQLGGNYFLSLDKYGASTDDEQILAYKGDELPIIEIAPARLVETPTEIMTVIQAYLDLGAPYTVTLDSSDVGLSVGYDFMKDTAEGISDVLSGTGAYPSNVPGLTMQELIGDNWTADEMRSVLTDPSADPTIAYVGGHYSANSGVAADYQTEFFPEDVINSQQNFANNLYFGNGCHMGYNIVNQHNDFDQDGNQVTEQPDWAQAFAIRGATLIAGTGYQYGDTDFIEYNEKIYLDLAKALRNGNAGGPISIGDAFVQAKNEYLKTVPVMRGIHQKSLMQTTIYGLPMLKYDLPGSAVPEVVNPSIFNNGAAPSEVGGDHPLNLHTYDLIRDYSDAGVGSLSEQPVTLTNIDNGTQVSAPYLVGPPPLGFVQSNLGEPILPRDEVNVTVLGNSSLVLRGVGFRGGAYVDYKRGDEQNEATWKYTLTGLAATELGGAHFDFLSSIFYPSMPWNVNRFDALTADADGTGNTLLNLLPAQYQADLPTPPDTTLRQYDNMAFKLFYSDWTDPVDGDLPALASAPSIVKVEGLVNNDGTVSFNVWVVGDPSAGIEEVWVTYTVLNDPTLAGTPGEWISVDLERSLGDISLWSNPNALVLPAGTNPQDVRFMAQACTGTGVCALNDNFGRHFIPGLTDLTATAVVLSGTTSIGPVGREVTFSATLVDQATNQPLNGLPIYFNLGSQTRFAVMENGTAEVTIPLLSVPGEYKVNAFFPGNAFYSQSAATPLDFTITKQATTIEWVPNNQPLFTNDSNKIIVALKDVDGNPLPEKSVLFKLESPIDTVYKSVITDQDGLARLGKVVLQEAPSYNVSAEFRGTSSYENSFTDSNSTISAIEVVVLETNDDGTTTILPSIWPTNNKPLPIEVRLADGNHTPLNYPYRFDLIQQDERVKKGPDAAIENACSTAWVLAERDGNGNGRVYRVSFTVLYPGGLEIPSVGYIATIPHDQSSDSQSIDDGPISGYFTSAVCQP